MSKRTPEMVLGILGGIFGLIGALIAMGIGGLASGLEQAFGGAGTAGSQVIGLSYLAIAASIIGLVGAATVRGKNTKRAGYLMIIGGVLGLIAISYAYILGAILLVLGGLLAIFRKV